MVCGIIGIMLLSLAGCGGLPPTEGVADEPKIITVDYVNNWIVSSSIASESAKAQQESTRYRQILTYIATVREQERLAAQLAEEAVSNAVASVVSYCNNCGTEGWLELLRQYDWPVNEAYRVMMCESSGIPNKTNGTSWGLFQINWPWHLEQLKIITGSKDPNLLFDPVVNVAVAYLIWSDGRTWSAWSCYP